MRGALPRGMALCHFDYHPDQVLLTAAGPVIIDWMTAFCGPAEADVARTALLLKHGALPHMPWLVRQIVGLIRKRILRVYLTEIQTHAPGITADRINAWLVPIAAARLAENIPEERELLLRLVATR